MKKILVPLDGSALAETALATAMTLARRWPAELVAVRAINPFVSVPAGTPDLALRLNEAEKEAAGEYLESISRKLEKAGLRNLTLMAFGEPISHVVKLARARRAGLVCLASHGRTGLSRWLLGSVAEGIMRQSPCPVLVCREGHGPGPLGFESVVVPHDGSPLSDEVRVRLEPFLAADARVTLLRTSDDLLRESSLYVDPDVYRDYLGGLEVALRQLDSEGRYRHVVLDSAPAEAILKVAAEHQADLIAMATHGRSGFDRFFLGSVTERVARHASCPVLAFPPGSVSEMARKQEEQLRHSRRGPE
jgi:nucleotide-binding universal stress UspA family protein